MAFVNLTPYVLTRGTPAFDGLEVAGWPLNCYEFGGFTGRLYFSPVRMTANIIVAVLVAAIAAWICRKGVIVTIRSYVSSVLAWRNTIDYREPDSR